MKKRKIFPLVMTTVLLIHLQVVPFSAFAIRAGQTVYTGECGEDGDNIIWTYDTTTQTMTFSGTGAMQKYVTSVGNDKTPEWVCEDSSIYDPKKVIFEEGITDIGELTPYIFGRNRKYCSLEIPESVKNISLTYINKDSLTYYTKYGSYFYYEVAYSVYQQGKGTLISTGVAENPIYPPEGTSETGLTWNFDYQTRTLTISGIDKNEEYLFGKLYPMLEISNNLIIDRDFVPPTHPDPSAPSLNHYLRFLLLEDNGVNNIYCYKDSPFSNAYESAISDYDVRFPSAIKNPFYGICKYIDDGTSVYCGDINLDGNVDLLDVIYLNKYASSIIQLMDAQKIVADCDGDGNVTDADVTTLMEYLMFQIPSLPYTGAEA